jgi:iron complex outermembrane receptor protein
MLEYISRFFIAIPFIVYPNIQDTIQSIDLDNVVVKSIKIYTKYQDAPLSVSYKDFSFEKNYTSKSSFSDFTNNIPGLYTSSSNNFSQDLRISLRGFGARSAFGIRGVKIIVDGIPETTPDGQSQLDNLPLGLISNIEVIRGPNANLYGNSSGGIISINTLSSSEEPYFKTKAIFGAYNYQSIQRTRIIDWKSSSLVLHYDKRRSSGYRDLSDYKSNIFNIKYQNEIDEKNKIIWQINYTDSPYSYDAGGLNLMEVKENKRQARKNNIDYDTYEKVFHFKTGISWNIKINPNTDLDSYFFYQNRDFSSKLPFNYGGIIYLDRDYYGLGFKYSNEKSYSNRIRSFAAGFDFTNQRDDRTRFKNNYGIKEDLTFDQIEKFKSTGIYFLNQTSFDSGIIVRYGLRYDNNMIGTDNEPYVSLASTNPSLGISYVKNNSSFFFSAGSSFETPTLNELSNNPNGPGLNKNLYPSSSTSYELGWRKSLSNLSFEAVVYNIKTDNEILQYELEEFPGKSFYQNIGATSRIGLELSSILLFSSGKLLISYTNTKNTFQDLANYDQNLNGLRLPGVPDQILDLELRLDINEKNSLIISNKFISEIFADNLNKDSVGSYNIINLNYSKQIFKNSEVFLGVNNITDEDYFDNIRINAFGKRYYEPAPNRNYYFGINLSF